MPHKNNPKRILDACRMSFDGTPDADLASDFNVSQGTISRWRSTDIWKDFEAELIASYKRQHLEATDFAGAATPT